MRIIKIIIIIFVLYGSIYSQNILKESSEGILLKFRRESNEFTLREENNQKIIDFINSLDESKSGFPKLPAKSFLVGIPPNSKITVNLEEKFYSNEENVIVELNPTLELADDSTLIYKPVKDKNQLFNLKTYPENEVEVKGYFWLRDFYVALIQLNTHRYNFETKSLIILDSCLINISFYDYDKNYFKNSTKLSFYDESLKDVLINYNKALAFRSYNTTLTFSDTTGQWIDYSKEYLKLAIPSDNVYRITYQNLISYGLNPAQINPRTFKLFVRGKEQPIFVYGEEDNSFDSTDYIEFYAEKNYSYQDYRRIVNVGQDYIQYMNRYTDTTIVWLTWDGNDGKRVNLVSENPIQTSDSITSHLVKFHFEQDVRLWYYDPVLPRVQLPFWQENKTFTWLVIGSSGSSSISFSARDFVPNSDVKVIARLISYASNGGTNAHKHGLSLNQTTPQDTITFNYRQTVNFTGIYNSSKLVQGNNVIRIFGLPSQASFHQSLVDWVDVEYFRKNVAINDSLKIIIPDSVQKDLRVVSIENVSNPMNLIIYKIKPEFKKVANFSISGTSPAVISFIDSVGGGDQYYITNTSKISTPILQSKKYFVNLRNSSRGADYILITNKLLQNSVNQYKNLIQNNYNLRVELVYDEDIYDEFSFGMLSAEAVKLFLMNAYRNWTPPKPTFLTLIGDANYDYKDVVSPAPTPRKKNILTSYGNPVSDVWYVMWDSVNVYFPQMYVGRIPTNNDEQVMVYLQKHQKYLQKKFDLFNKSFLFFSGGDATKPNELAQIKAANENVMNNLVKSSPLFGNATHFYKTINPPTNFGPYSLEEVQRIIDEGGLFISYIGHSGTRTWDNSISEVEHIKNKYVDRFPLISDFGCSTGKFAEPDVDAFGELFVCQSPNGQAISYLGNSSWGYLSTSLRFPGYFYDILVRDSIKNIGRAHTLAKIRQLLETGTGDVNRVFTYCNLLLGDPVIGLQIPTKPNFKMDESKIKLLTEQPNDMMDSIKFRVVISNYGIVNGDSVKILIADKNQDTLIFSKLLSAPFTKFEDTLEVSVPVSNFIGNRKLEVKIDPENLIDEIYEDDNSAEFNYIINSTSVNSIEANDFYSTSHDFIEVINPFIKRENSPERIRLEYSTSSDFSQPRTIITDFDTLITKVQLNNLIPGQRYFYRIKIDDPSAFWTKTKSFIQKNSQYTLYIEEETSQREKFYYEKTFYDSISKSWKLDEDVINLKILSAGGYDGAFGSIQWNGYEQLPLTYYWGLATAIIDSITLQPTSIRYFNVPDPGVSDSLTNYVNRLPAGTLIAMAISADAAQGVLGYSGNTPPRNAIKTLGSLYIDSIRYREGWCILGKKGAAIGTVPEDYKKIFAGIAQIEVTKKVTYDSGFVVFPEMEFSGKWNYLKIESERPENSNILLIPLGIKRNGEVDTLYQYSTYQDSINLTSLDAKVYPSIKLLAKLYSNSLKESPKIFSVAASYIPVPELAVNYQTISIDRDTIMQGELVNYQAKIFNVGKSDADSFKILLELIRSDNSSYVLVDSVIYRLEKNSYFTLNYQYVNKIYDGFGNFAFKLTMDSDNSVNEFFENNNIFYKSFYIKKDTTTSVSETSVSVLFNGKEIREWEYVEPDAKIEIKIFYPIWFPFTDTSSVQVYLDGERYYSNQLTYSYDSIERKIEIILETKLSKGEHNLRVYTKDAFGRISNQPVVDKYFKVTDDLELRNVYNYPNPFSKETYFTFILTQIPDEVQIKIYTVAGRLIKEFKLSSSELTTNFNKIFWDGRDEDGDLIGNGVYLYKVIAKKGDRVTSTIQKLAVVR